MENEERALGLLVRKLVGWTQALPTTDREDRALLLATQDRDRTGASGEQEHHEQEQDEMVRLAMQFRLIKKELAADLLLAVGAQKRKLGRAIRKKKLEQQQQEEQQKEEQHEQQEKEEEEEAKEELYS